MCKRTAFASVADAEAFWRPMSTEEQTRAAYLLPVISDVLRQEANHVGKDLDDMLLSGEIIENVVKSVTVDILARMMVTPTDDVPMTQMTQSALGYSVTGTYLVPGGGLFVKRAELARLGLRRQRYGVIDLA